MTKKKNSSPTKGQKLSAPDLQRQIFALFQRNPKKQLNPRQVIAKLKIDNNKDSVQHALELLTQSEALVHKGDFMYQLNRLHEHRSDSQHLSGVVDMTRTGAAYVMVEGQEMDIFVPPSRVNTAMQGDRVQVRFWTPRGRRKPEGEIIEILERATEQFVGIIHLFSRFALVSVEAKQSLEIYIELDDIKTAKEGDLVAVSIVNWKSSRLDTPKGEIVAVLGQPGTSDLDMQAILINNGFNIAFPEEVIKASEALDTHISEEEIARRRDFREVLTFTIDPTDAKDFDDAISLQTHEDGSLEIGVHIADVTHYVLPGTALDQEAYRRSTSVYLVDRVCPMLPEKISNELCSLRPNEDKLTFSATFVLDKQFRVRKRWFGKGIIHSQRRFTYEEAQAVLETGEGDLSEELLLLNKIAHKLRERRFKEGSIDFAAEEVRFELAPDGTPLRVYVKERKDSNMLIEDFMLLANREVATFIAEKEKAHSTKIPFVYRVHDEPDPDKAYELAQFAAMMGFPMDVSSGEAIAKSYNRLMQQAEHDPGLKMLTPLAIRTMAKAVYSSNNIGHYGLGFQYYSHFTSPIRRYSDVLAHRILEKNLADDALFQLNGLKLEEQCKHISNQERKAAEAERESIKYKQVEFMEKHVGEVFHGIITGLTDFGVFVEMTESRCEGRIGYQYMDQSYELGAGGLSIRGLSNKKVLRVGDEVKVKVLEADRKRRKIDLVFIDGPLNDSNVVFTSSEPTAPAAERKPRQSTRGGSKADARVKNARNARAKQSEPRQSSQRKSRKGTEKK